MLTISDRLKAAMARRKIKVPELARTSGVSAPYIYELLNGTATNPSTEKLEKIARALAMSPGALFPEDPVPSSASSVISTESRSPDNLDRRIADSIELPPSITTIPQQALID